MKNILDICLSLKPARQVLEDFSGHLKNHWEVAALMLADSCSYLLELGNLIRLKLAVMMSN